jgi:hypothetical protein
MNGGGARGDVELELAIVASGIASISADDDHGWTSGFRTYFFRKNENYYFDLC